ncbi:MAG: cupin domain-containing protein [Desulfurococcales archaeon]|nr:cupin domain-containing protein [Desulfurococcales archaeon]
MNKFDPCGAKVLHYTEVEEERVPDKMGSKTTIRWLISEKDGAPTYAMRYFRIGPGGHINAHSHPWEHEIFVVKGQGVVRIGEKHYQVGEGYSIYVPPNIIHEYWNTSLEPWEIICTIPNKPSVNEDKPVEKC